ncbi:Hsp20/alpha crystallin family protein [Staphylococcus sp. SQ8-PEA]|uniref:Hsp20/alpha crystallin family protein n=1 Tax=Staphylococcus marylandisciuri TaxID=2981529 RepID=A0ABT2QMT9_9STAP|nr:Hsp20/alpha crystallin family protein [Staphylococcus marylandisciuri]MCU5745285.1 Hsp20/alpha crystallin family protein [Staphylococcus marylandisciuri]
MGFDMRPFNNSFFNTDPSDFFRDVGRQFFDQFPSTGGITTDVKELEDSYLVEAELPGMSKENISLNFENNVLTIEGKQSVENSEEDTNGRVIHRERSVNDVKRQLSFDNIQEDGIKASYDNGILNITLPKKDKEDNSNTNIQID